MTVCLNNNCGSTPWYKLLGGFRTEFIKIFNSPLARQTATMMIVFKFPNQQNVRDCHEGKVSVKIIPESWQFLMMMIKCLNFQITPRNEDYSPGLTVGLGLGLLDWELNERGLISIMPFMTKLSLALGLPASNCLYNYNWIIKSTERSRSDLE